MLDRETRLEILKWVGAFCTLSGVLATTFKLKVVVDQVFIIGSLMFLLGIVLFLLRAEISKPDFKTLRHQTHLRIDDPDGKRATLFRHIEQKAMRSLNAATILVARVEADGPIKHAWLDGHEVQLDQPARVHIYKNHDPINRGEIMKTDLKFEMEDAYRKSTETLTVPIAYRIKDLSIEVSLHPDKPSALTPLPRTTLLYYDYPHQSARGTTRSPDGTRITYETKNPRLGQQYRITWDW
jgi:hypothetical protein